MEATKANIRKEAFKDIHGLINNFFLILDRMTQSERNHCFNIREERWKNSEELMKLCFSKKVFDLEDINENLIWDVYCAKILIENTYEIEFNIYGNNDILFPIFKQNKLI